MTPGAHRLACALLAGCAGLAGCSGLAGPGREGSATQSPSVPDGILGIYQGSFGSAHTDDPADDLNYIPCEPANERCLGGDEPLVDVLLELRRDPDGRVRIGFFRSAAAVAQRNELDLLGRGCLTVIGPLAGWTGDQAAGDGVAVFPLEAGNRLCLNKLRPTSTHELRVRFGTDPDSGESVAQVLIDREVRSANYLYVEEGGKRRRVRIDLANTLETATDTRYRVCIEDDLGEYERCVMTDRELRRFVLPVPLPEGAALSYTWWYELTPKLRRTHGLYELEQHSGHFVRSGPGMTGLGAAADRDLEIAPTHSR